MSMICLAIVGCGRSSKPDPSPVIVASPDAKAVPGYVEDQACRRCHADFFKSFQSTGMGRSFFPPDASNSIETFGRTFTHSASNQHFEMKMVDGSYVFRRFQKSVDGMEVNVFEQPVDWVLGSGNNARTYLYQTPAGELFQLPIAWYSEERQWGMAPGYDRPDHEGVTRRVRRECLFCHNAYPDVPAHSDLHGASQSFPQKLPHGIGCQRCHGPGAKHVQAHEEGVAANASDIVNPSKLSAELRDDVCHQCHWQPSVTLFGLRRFGRGDYSFQPGQKLADYQIDLDIVDDNRPAEDRFEINHHPYRLRQSHCFLQSNGKLSCLTCHDPHRSVLTADRANHYRTACQSCHEPTACHRPERPVTADTSDCVACHMPRRRTQDVVHVVATDHRIGRPSANPADLLAPLAESEPSLDDVVVPAAERGTDWGDIYRAVAVLRATNGHHASAAEHLAKRLARTNVDSPEPYVDLAQAQVVLGKPVEALSTLHSLIQRHLENPAALEVQGLAHLNLGALDEAEKSFRLSLARDPHRSVAALHLGRLELTRNRPDQAITQLQQVVKSHPTLAAAWYHLGEAHARQSHWPQAAESYRRALEIDPTLKEAYFGIERALKELNRPEEAVRYQQHLRTLPKAQ